MARQEGLRQDDMRQIVSWMCSRGVCAQRVRFGVAERLVMPFGDRLVLAGSIQSPIASRGAG